MMRRTALKRAAAGRPVEVFPLESRVLLSAIYVATDGADGNPGTLQQPLRSINAAAQLAQPGDTVFIRGGTYRETVRPSRSGAADAPITFTAYNGETVTVSGADPVTGWSKHSGSVYKANQAWDLGTTMNQVFVDGRMMIEARWPNTTLDVSRPKKNGADSVTAVFAGDASYATLKDSPLGSFPAGAWTGGTVHVTSGQGWVTQTATITSSAPGQISFDYVQRLNPKSDRFETPQAGDKYFLTGKFVALDAAGEWFRESDGTLYLWTPASDNPASHAVEAKRRKYAFDLSGRSFVNVTDVDLFAATVFTDAASSSIHLDGLDAKYTGHFFRSPTGWEVSLDTGILLAGTDSSLRNSTIRYSAGHGVAVDGQRNVIENNVIQDFAYSGANGAGVRAIGVGHLIRSNTVFDGGRSGILHSRLTRGRILHNVIHDVMLQATDGGGTYTYGTDGEGTEVAYNRIYNINTSGFGGVGLYLDNGSANHVVHHNLVYNVTYGTKLNPPSYTNQLFNNTLVANSRSVATSGTKDMTGTSFRNNIFTKSADIGPGAIKQSNLSSSTSPQFVNASGRDYRLQSTSPAIDMGVAVSPYTDGYGGRAPDAGALEYGKTAWTAGASSSLVVPDEVAPAAPRGLTAVASSAGISLDWPDSLEPDRTGYHVYRSTSASGPFTRLNDLPVSASKFHDATAPQNATSHYRVVAIDSSGNVSAAGTVSAFLPTAKTLPLAPTGLVAVPASARHIDLAWQAVATVIGYRIERRGPGETEFREIGRSDTPRLRDSGLTPGASYTYRVRSENLAGVSAAGGQVTSAPMATPSGLEVSVASGMQADLSWSDVAGETIYLIQRSADGQSGWLNVGSTVPDDTTFSDVSVPTSRKYFYRVVARGAGGDSLPSAVVATGTTQTPSGDYASQDVGGSTPAGSARVITEGSAYDVTGGGRDIQGTADQFHFAYRQVTGNFDFKVRLASLTAADSWTKAGLMARAGLTAGSANAFILATPGSNGHRMQSRATENGSTSVGGSGAVAYPNTWLRLTRVGNVFTGYRSTDGMNWTIVGTSRTVALPQTVYFGMAVTSHNTSRLATAQFRDLR